MTNSSTNEPKFVIGNIITLKSHPLVFQKNGLIDASINQIPPLMCVKEIHYEKKKKKFSAENDGNQIADNTKYLCTYFNQHRMIFEDKMIYESMLVGFDKLKFHRNDEKIEESGLTLIEETKDYKKLKDEDYTYGKTVFFKTYKLEKRKKFASKSIDINSNKKSAVVHTSPAFITSGVKTNDQKTIYDEKSGEPIKTNAKNLFKVLWYNSYQEKMSEDYMPKEFFTDDERIIITKAKPSKTSK
jgi:hypothetical protein